VTGRSPCLIPLALVVATTAVAPVGAVGDKAYSLATRLASAIERCWIASGDPAFADYVYSPEPNNNAGPRILIVPRAAPGERPLLVIEIDNAGTNVNAYGPLAQSAQAGRIGADLRRWINGGDGCK
jgi:hypothetical protein